MKRKPNEGFGNLGPIDLYLRLDKKKFRFSIAGRILKLFFLKNGNRRG